MRHKKSRIISMLLAAALLCSCAQPVAEAQPAAAQPTAEPTATAAPTQSPVDAMIAEMTLREKIGQMFMVRPDALDFTLPQDQINDANAAGSTGLTADMQLNLAQYPVGGIVVFGKNITDEAQLTAMLQAWQQAADVGLLTGIDEEGGSIARIANHPAFTVPQYGSAAAVGAAGDTEAARDMGATIGAYLKGYGFNLDFAPDADVNTNPDNPVIGSRAFSSDPQTAADMVAAAVEGFHSSGIACAIKHYPGHGDTSTDSHYGCASSEKTWQQLFECELLPFKAGIAAGADMVMAAHITLPNVTDDGLPASLSAQLLTTRLRGELGYSGVIITDSLAMQAISDYYTPAEAACMAIAAGNDILLMPNGLREAFDGVVAAVEGGEITEARIDESVRRVLALKQSLGLI